MPPNKLLLEVPPSQKSDFSNFLLRHQKIKSVQMRESNFLAELNLHTQEEYFTLIQEIGKIYSILTLTEVSLCQAHCRDGTNCLNQAKYGEFCWKHKD